MDHGSLLGMLDIGKEIIIGIRLQLSSHMQYHRGESGGGGGFQWRCID